MDQYQLKELHSHITRVNELSYDILRKVEERMKELALKEEEWKQMEKKLEENESKRSNKIVLDVGGKKFSTTKDTLLSQSDTYFSALLRSDKLKTQEDGSYFIDRSPKHFGIILEYLRTGQLFVGNLNNDQIAALKIDLDFYLINLGIPDSMVDQQIGNSNDSIITAGHKLLIEYWSGKVFGQLLWKASEHGFSASQFHERCDGKGPTVTIIKSTNGCVFGGYAAVSWNSAGSYYGSGNCFLFTLLNPHNIPPTKYNQAGVYYLFGSAAYGPTFGGGYDLHISNNSNDNIGKSSFSDFSYSYVDTTGKGKKTFTGSKYFTTSEIEVYEMK